MVQWKMSPDEVRRRLAIVESALRNPDVRNRAQLLEVKAKLEMKLMATDDPPRAAVPKQTPTPNHLRQMLARVNADLPRETDLDRASDLRILKMMLETAIELSALADPQSSDSASAPPGVTIH
jgi:hypothetical protein